MWSDWDIPRRMMQADYQAGMVSMFVAVDLSIYIYLHIYNMYKLMQVALWIKEKNEETGEYGP